jgi:hypothetical protein
MTTLWKKAFDKPTHSRNVAQVDCPKSRILYQLSLQAREKGALSFVWFAIDHFQLGV